jgi:FixJ family two-component response regulator
MRKPLLLLVDDDPAVLGALEAELTASFGEICRIEPFGDPAEVLAAVPGWTATGADLALAIVDQKMPGMSGLELLRALAGTPPAARLRTILLTGYAGLESALTAKNEIAIDLYLEKPWRTAELADACREQLGLALQARDALRAFRFRPLADAAELVTHLRIRHEVFHTARGATHDGDDDGLAMDLDPYDLTARHFGLFAVAADREEMVGTQRIVGMHAGPLAGVLRSMAADDVRVARRLLAPRRQALPFLAHLAPGDDAADLRARVERQAATSCEADRFALPPARRCGPRELALLGEHLIAAQVARFALAEGVTLFAAVATSRVQPYDPYGFRECLRADYRGIEWSLLLHDRDAMTGPALVTCRALGERLARTGSTCRCAAFAACVAGDYVAAEFRGSELFCPLAAQRIIGDAARDAMR